MVVEGSSGGSGGAVAAPGMDELRLGFQGVQELCTTLTQSLQAQNDKLAIAEANALVDSKRALDAKEQVCRPVRGRCGPLWAVVGRCGPLSAVVPAGYGTLFVCLWIAVCVALSRSVLCVGLVSADAISAVRRPAPSQRQHSTRATGTVAGCTTPSLSLTCSLLCVHVSSPPVGFTHDGRTVPCRGKPTRSWGVFSCGQCSAMDSECGRLRRRCAVFEHIMSAILCDSGCVVHQRHLDSIAVRPGVG